MKHGWQHQLVEKIINLKQFIDIISNMKQIRQSFFCNTQVNTYNSKYK